MLAKIQSYGLTGIHGFEIQIEIDVSNGIPSIEMVGLPDAAVKEARERVKSAIRNSGFNFFAKKITVNFAPADIKKEGPMYDLPIALGILAASGQINGDHLRADGSSAIDFGDFVVVGELSLDGQIRKIRGILPIIISAQARGCKNIIIPKGNTPEASFIDGVNVYALSTLSEAVEFFRGNRPMPTPKLDIASEVSSGRYGEDFKYVRGQYAAKRALEIAAAGSHNILLIGPPGGGKTLLARCIPSILPDMTVAEALESTKIHSVAGCLDEKKGIVTTRPFRTPHHSASRFALTGGGNSAKPGEISLAHNGVLFLDEMLEYSRGSLEILRQPLEDNVITVARAARSVEYPANFMLIASMNPCPCGNSGSDKECTCTPAQVAKYLSKLSGPLMDRIDLHIEVGSITYDELSDKVEAEGSREIRKRVNAARRRQLERFESVQDSTCTKIYANAKMSNSMVNDFCKLSQKSESMLKTAFDRLGLSARAYMRILKVARTIADLEGCEDIGEAHIAEAVGYRTLDRSEHGRI